MSVLYLAAFSSAFYGCGPEKGDWFGKLIGKLCTQDVVWFIVGFGFKRLSPMRQTTDVYLIFVLILVGLYTFTKVVFVMLLTPSLSCLSVHLCITC